MATVTISVRVPKAEADRLHRAAAAAGLDRASLLKQAIRRGCAEVLLERALEAYRRGEVTLSRAAAIANLSPRELLLRFPAAGIVLNYQAADLQKDLAD